MRRISFPKLPALDKDDVNAVRNFLPGKLLGRTAALLSLVLLLTGTQVTDLTPLKNITTLTQLYLGGTQRSIAGLLTRLIPTECRNFFSNAGYASS